MTKDLFHEHCLEGSFTSSEDTKRVIIIKKVFIKNSLRKQTCNNLHEEIMINCN